MRASTLAVGLALAAALVPRGPAAGQDAPASGPGWIGIEVKSSVSLDRLGDQRSTNLITAVRERSPAARAGIRPGDLLLAINGRPYRDGFPELVRTLRPGDPVRMVVARDGRRQDLTVIAGARPDAVLARSGWTATARADSVVETMYRQMDSLRHLLLRGVASGSPSPLPAEPRRAGGDALRRVGDGSGPPGARPLDAVGRDFPLERTDEPDGLPLPFGLFLFRGDGRDEGEPAGESGREGRRSDLSVEMRFSTDVGRAARELTFRPFEPDVLGRNRAAGAEIVELRSSELAEYFEVDGGVLVVDVAEGTPAALTGLQPGDVVTAIADLPVSTIAEFRQALARGQPPIGLVVVRKGRTIALVLKP